MKHKTIKTTHVYTKNNQVFLKNTTKENTVENEEWYPINFQWIPLLKLQNDLKL